MEDQTEANPWGLNWAAPAGLELTYVSPNELPNNNSFFRSYRGVITYSEVAEEMRTVHYQVWEGPKGQLCRDPGCVEWSTPVLKSWAQAKTAWEYGHTLADMFGLVEEHDRVAGGMGHIHVSCTDRKVEHAILADIYCRPYVAWAFSHPSCVQFCNPQYLANAVPPLGLKAEEGYETNKYSDINAVSQLAEHKFGTTRSGRTLEFRVFNMAPDWDTQYLHLAFAQRYVEFMTDKVNSGKITPCLSARVTKRGEWPYNYSDADQEMFYGFQQIVHQSYSNTLGRCVREFRQLIEQLGLPWSHYQGFVDQNLRPRFAWGRPKREYRKKIASHVRTHEVFNPDLGTDLHISSFQAPASHWV